MAHPADDLQESRGAASSVVQALNDRGHVAMYVETAQEALRKVLELIPETASVGVPGTLTIRQIGAIEALLARGNKVIGHWGDAGDLPAAEARFEEMRCDVFLTSSNALLEDGRMVNVDGVGNRLAAMCFSQGDRIFVIGLNKLCPNIPTALNRIRDYAGPKNASRLNKSLADSPDALKKVVDQISRVTLITEKAPTMTGAHKSYVILVGEPLGY